MRTQHNNPFDTSSIPESRYQRDAAFRGLVDVLQHFIQRAQFTPTEVREAALLACIHYESYTVRSQYLDPDQFESSMIASHERRPHVNTTGTNQD